MIFIKKKLINLYINKNKYNIYTKFKSTTITKDVLGKCFYVYNGKNWIKKPINNEFFFYKSVGSLKNINTKIRSIYKKKKQKKKKSIKK